MKENILGKPYEVLGSNDCDLILRTNSKIKIQCRGKFIEIPFQNDFVNANPNIVSFSETPQQTSVQSKTSLNDITDNVLYEQPSIQSEQNNALDSKIQDLEFKITVLNGNILYLQEELEKLKSLK